MNYFLGKKRATEEALSKAVSIATTTAIAAALMLAGCHTPTSMEQAEKNLEIAGPNERQFHSVLYFPKGEALHYPGYLVAIEKSPQDIIGGPKVKPNTVEDPKGDHPLVYADATYIQHETKTFLIDNTPTLIKHFQTRDRKALFISHIVRYGIDTPEEGRANQMVYQCFIYNAYKARGVAKDGLTDVDYLRQFNWKDCVDEETSPGSLPVSFPAREIGTLYADGLNALKPLETQLTRDVKANGYTHILVIVMGWNTSQDEAIRNFNDIAGNIVDAAYEEKLIKDGKKGDTGKKDISRKPVSSPFRPLVVGVTWPSFWTSGVANFFSYPNKADDADELGLSWLNVLLYRTLPCVLKSTAGANGKITLRTVLIGHSFGARAATRALFSSPVLEQDSTENGKPPASVVDLAVGLQGAVSINRFVPSTSEEGAPYRNFANLTGTRVVLTASDKDQATAWPSWYPAAGSIHSYRKACDGSNTEYANVFSCWTARDISGSDASNEPEHKSKLYRPSRLCPGGITDCTISEDEEAKLAENKVMYIDTSAGITEFNTPGSGGGAHSDIYRLPMGRLLWHLIHVHAPTGEHTPRSPLKCGTSDIAADVG
ncbi:hypothetical protein [Paraburkholderia strydomiana]|uniref:hypothetical protein n=1 Tax=Paraburkholderia strydomiana TaxID=1245417 RepID=UPI00285E6EDA|nr:hypothetical protein [Paraburkholderia strydomiana]MDR7009673.1 hypothetical protein [Paraburkholderia strydomiana]